MTSKSFPHVGVSLAVLCLPTIAAAQEDVVRDEIVVTASPLERSAEETIVGSTVLSGDELERNLSGSIGETLRRQPGISSTFFGPAASRPVIRGLGGDRISVLDSGIGSIDASSTSPDHAVAVEPATAEKIEIVRGAATLLYGSSAAGGVVNVFSGKVPSAVPDDGVDGALRVGGSSADEGVDAAGGFDVDLGAAGAGAFVFHGEGFYRRADDYKVPGFVESERLRAAEEASGEHNHDGEDAAFGRVANTSLETKGGAAGLSYVFDNGFLGVSGTAINTDYGVPGAHGDHEEDAASLGGLEKGVTIALKQRRIDLDSEIDSDLLFFEKAKLRVGYADYAHTEIEPSGAPGTIFANEGVEGRLELVDDDARAAGGTLKGAYGFQWKLRDFSAVGDEAFVPKVRSRQFGLFGLEEYERGVLRLEAGARYERTRHRAPTIAADRSFDAWSVSAGVGLTPADGVFLGVTGLRTERAPSPEELFSNGPHLATGVFEIGDPTLGVETARGVEATVKFSNDAISFIVNGFYTSYRDFIFENFTGADADIDGDLIPIVRFEASDATFKGFEAQLDAELFRIGPFHIHGHAATDYVRATADRSATGNLPRIPPLSGLFALEANSDIFDFRGEIEHARAQEEVGFNELPTDGYTQYNLYATFRPMGSDSPISLRLAALNISNEDARLHTSFLKDVAPLPGRNIKISVDGKF
ncbi:MAG: TonB-dependent receptor [Parvularculaceae bacterium]|nr:TonB-dependent receptor [Parvularculaceae bacterium]